MLNWRSAKAGDFNRGLKARFSCDINSPPSSWASGVLAGIEAERSSKLLWVDEFGDKWQFCMVCNVDEKLEKIAHEIFTVAQLLPNEGVSDSVERIIEVLDKNGISF